MSSRKSRLEAAIVILMITIAITSCTPARVLTTNPIPQTVVQTTPPTKNDPMSSAISAAKTALAEQLQVGEQAIQLLDIQPVQWPDGCLGIQQLGIMCAMHVVDGYRITLSANNQTYEVRSNLDGSQTVVVTEQVTTSAPIKTQSGALQITDVSFSVGGDNGEPGRQTLSYNVVINNPSNRVVTLLWLEPVLQNSISVRVLDTDLRNAVNKVLEPNSQEGIHGQLTLNTNGLSKLEITQLASLFNGFTISTNQTILLHNYSRVKNENQN
jgi:hypothetical protein